MSIRPAPTPNRLRSKAAAAVAIVAAGAGVLGCSDNSGDSVAILGDSITSLDEADLNSSLGGDYELTISGNFGRTIEEVRPEAELLSSRDHDQVIINLGTNDVLQQLDVETSIETLAAEVELFDSARCVHLVNINEHMVAPADGSSRSSEAEEFNRELERYAERTERVSVIDWNSVAASELDGGDPPTSELTTDTIHPTPEGFSKLNSLYGDALAGCGDLI